MEDINQYEKVDIYRGYKYAIWLNASYGYRCGYVELPENHPLYEKSFTDYDFQQIQLTFSGHIKGLSGWFIGWDHHHIWDGIDEEAVLEYYKDLPESEQNVKLEYAKSFGNNEYGLVSYLEDVERECHDVIDYLISNKNYEIHD